MILTRESRRTLSKTCPSAKFFTKSHVYRSGVDLWSTGICFTFFSFSSSFSWCLFVLPLHFVCLFSFLFVPYLHCSDRYICVQTESAKNWGVYLCDTSTLWVGFSIHLFISFYFTTRTVIRLHGFEWLGDFEEWIVKNLEGSVRDKS